MSDHNTLPARRRDGSPCRCDRCIPAAKPRARARTGGRGVMQGRDMSPSSTTDLVGRGLSPRAVAEGWVELLSPLPVQLQIHGSPQLGLGVGSWRYFGETARGVLTREAGCGVALWGVMQGNDWPRTLYHTHWLAFGSEDLRGVRWASVAEELEDMKLSPAWRPHAGEFPNELRVRVRPVDARGSGADSLIAYCARYFVRMPDGLWLEAGDLSRFMQREVVLT